MPAETLIAENGSYRLELNRTNMGIILTDLSSGEQWGSSPVSSNGEELDEFGMPVKKHPQVESVLLVKCQNVLGTTEDTYLSYIDAVQEGRIRYKTIENGLCIEFYFCLLYTSYIWLDEGPHTISLEVTIAENAEYFERLSKVVQKLGDEYIKMVMITGESPDVNRDYELFNQIPGFTETLTACRDALDSLAEDMKAASGKRGTQSIASMQNMSRVLNAMLKSPYVAQQYICLLYTSIRLYQKSGVGGLWLAE